MTRRAQGHTDLAGHKSLTFFFPVLESFRRVACWAPQDEPWESAEQDEERMQQRPPLGVENGPSSYSLEGRKGVRQPDLSPMEVLPVTTAPSCPAQEDA